MKKTLLFLSIVTFFISCTKSDGNNTTNTNANLNGTEQKLLGTWYLKKEADSVVLNGSLDTSQTKMYNSFAGTNYVIFKQSVTGATPAGGSNAKDMEDGMQLMNMPGTNGAARSLYPMNVQQLFWYYNTTNAKLIASQISSGEIMELTTTKLTLKYVVSNDPDVKIWYTLYLEK